MPGRRSRRLLARRAAASGRVGVRPVPLARGGSALPWRSAMIGEGASDALVDELGEALEDLDVARVAEVACAPS